MRDVASHRLKRSLRAALTTLVMAAAVVFGPASAIADPDIDTRSEALQRLDKLSRQAEIIQEKLHRANDDLDAREKDLRQAKAAAKKAEQAAGKARAKEAKFRKKVDRLTESIYQGARMSKLSALLASDSPSAFLDRASTLDMLAQDKHEIVTALSNATEKAKAAAQRAKRERKRAAEAAADARRLRNKIDDKRDAKQEQIAKVKDQLAELTSAERSAWAEHTNYTLQGGSGTGAAAARAALSQQGDPYVWGAEGPDSYDCSGLMQWAYAQVGVSIPRSSSAQAQAGVPVSHSELQPGDMIFYYSPVSHVAMYVGNGMAVHASTPGQPVHVDGYRDIAPINTMRRVAN